MQLPHIEAFDKQAFQFSSLINNTEAECFPAVLMSTVTPEPMWCQMSSLDF